METKQIGDDLSPQDRVQINQLLNEMSVQVQADRAAESTSIANLYEKWRRYDKIRQILVFSDYDPRDIRDGAFRLYARFFSGCYAAYLLTRRLGKTRFVLGLVPLFCWENLVVNKMSLEKGINRKAIFGDDRLSQDCRLLLAFFFPEHPHRDLLWNRIRHFQGNQN